MSQIEIEIETEIQRERESQMLVRTFNPDPGWGRFSTARAAGADAACEALDHEPKKDTHTHKQKKMHEQHQVSSGANYLPKFLPISFFRRVSRLRGVS